MIGAVALIVIGPEKLPRVARTVGTLLGKAQRYVNDVKAEVNRSMELDELRAMKDTVEGAARDVEGSIRAGSQEVQNQFGDLEYGNDRGLDTASTFEPAPFYPTYKNPGKNWRLKKGATPNWYKSRAGVRTKALSGAARVARYRPHRFK